MNEQSLPLSALDAYAPVQSEKADALLKAALDQHRDKIVVIDDDPTGVQTVHDVHVYTDWTEQSILEGFEEENRMFFLLTNSRSMSRKETREVHEQIARGVMQGVPGHGQALCDHQPERLHAARALPPGDGNAAPGDRARRRSSPMTARSCAPSSARAAATRWATYTMSRRATGWSPPDRRSLPATGRSATRIRGWMNGARKRPAAPTRPPKPPASRWRCCADLDVDGVARLLEGVHGFRKVVVNAAAYEDVKVFLAGYLKACAAGKRFMFRTAAAVPKLLGGVSDKPLLTRGELVRGNAAPTAG